MDGAGPRSSIGSSGKLEGVVEEVRLNPNLGTFAWVLHRLTGLGLALYLVLHLWALGAAAGGPAALEARLALFETASFRVLEVLVIGAVAFHMLNGVRIIVVDFARFSRWQKELFGAALAISLLVMAYTAWVFFARIAA